MGSFDRYELNALRDFVQHELCSRNQLIPNAFPMSERVVSKSGGACGIFFCVHGPRSVRLTAVYDVCRQEIHFYDSNGRRSESQAWSLDMVAASA
jgi:hypothetical protein